MSAQMSFEEFQQSITSGTAPASMSLALLALWHDASGDWSKAHDLAQEAGGKEGAWVHAYLHRKEGDEANARYWYARAGQPRGTGDLPDEWAALVRALLA